jgi:hypothetical protein
MRRETANHNNQHINKEMKLSLNLFTHRLNVELRRKRRLLTATDCAKELGLNPMTVRNYGRIQKIKREGTKVVGLSHQTAFLYDLDEVRKVAFK